MSSTLSPALTRLRRLQAGITERQHSSLCGFRCLLAHEAHRQGADGQELRMLGAGGGVPWLCRDNGTEILGVKESSSNSSGC